MNSEIQRGGGMPSSYGFWILESTRDVTPCGYGFQDSIGGDAPSTRICQSIWRGCPPVRYLIAHICRSTAHICRSMVLLWFVCVFVVFFRFVFFFAIFDVFEVFGSFAVFEVIEAFEVFEVLAVFFLCF